MLQSGKPQVARLRSPRRPRIEDSRDHENRRFSNDCARLTIRGLLRALPPVACLHHREAKLPELTALAVNARDGLSDLPLSIPPVSAVFPVETR